MKIMRLSWILSNPVRLILPNGPFTDGVSPLKSNARTIGGCASERVGIERADMAEKGIPCRTREIMTKIFVRLQRFWYSESDTYCD